MLYKPRDQVIAVQNTFIVTAGLVWKRPPTCWGSFYASSVGTESQTEFGVFLLL